MSSLLKGIAASNGIAIAKAYRLVEPDLSVEKNSVDNADSGSFTFSECHCKSKSELEAIRDKAKVDLGEDKAANL